MDIPVYVSKLSTDVVLMGAATVPSLLLNIQYSAFLAFFEASPSKEITRLKPLLTNDCYSTNA